MFGFAKKLVKQAEGIIAPEIDAKGPTYGFRVVHIEPGSEAFHAGLEPLFDYIIAANGIRFDSRYHPSGGPAIGVEQEQSPHAELEDVINGTHGRLLLEVWSAKGRSVRVVTLPNPAKQSNGLGMSLQWSPLGAADHVWHVLNVVPHSPADEAGLVSHADYIVAAENGLLEAGGEYLLGRVVSRTNPSDGVLFYVYNRDYNVVRPVRIFPTRDGKLGCGVGYGLLHALPAVSKSNPQVPPGHTLFDDVDSDGDDGNKFIPGGVMPPMPSAASASVKSVPPPPPGQVRPVHAPPNHHHHNPGNAEQNLSEYFEEQTKLSREVDGSATDKKLSVPPPPKSN